MGSKIKRFSNFISQIPPKHTSWKTSQSHIKISQWIFETSIFQSRLSLSSSFLPLWDLWYGVKLYVPTERNENVNKGKLKRYHWENMTTIKILREKYVRMSLRECVCVCVWTVNQWEVWVRENEREQRREMSWVNLTHFCICGHTPTPKQTSVSKSHKSPHISSSVWGTLTHSLTTYIFGCQVRFTLDERVHTLHWSFIGSVVKGCLRERRKC